MDFSQDLDPPQAFTAPFDYYMLFPTRPSTVVFTLDGHNIIHDLPKTWGDTDAVASGSNSYTFMFLCQNCKSPHITQVLWGEGIRMPQLLGANLQPLPANLQITEDRNFLDNLLDKD